jgi:tetratricopeptide (TPR) repeat protein
MSSTTTTLDEDHRTLKERPTLSNVRASVSRHPLDNFSYAIAADYYERRGDPRAIRLLNHALLLHPTHPDLHRMAARILYREGFIAQAATEYAAALRSTTLPEKLVVEILVRFPKEQAAAALPVDYVQPELLVRAMTDAGRGDVATLWLARVLEQRPRDARACERLVTMAEQGNVTAAQIAGQRCGELLPDYQSRLELAQILAKNHGEADVVRLLADVESWQSRVDDKINAWLVLCDAHVALGHGEDARRCLHRLDASPDMRVERRAEVVKRLETLKAP